MSKIYTKVRFKSLAVTESWLKPKSINKFKKDATENNYINQIYHSKCYFDTVGIRWYLDYLQILLVFFGKFCNINKIDCKIDAVNAV